MSREIIGSVIIARAGARSARWRPLALFYLRRIQTGASRKQVGRIECRFPLDVAQYLLNNKRQEIMELEEKYDTEMVDHLPIRP